MPDYLINEQQEKQKELCLFLDNLFHHLNQEKTAHQCFIQYQDMTFRKIEFYSVSFSGDPEEAFLSDAIISSILEKDIEYSYLIAHVEKNKLEATLKVNNHNLSNKVKV